MAVTSTKNSISHTGDGVQTVFPYDFLVPRASDLNVLLDSVEQTTGFTVNGVGESVGGNVVFSVPPGAGVIVDLIRIVPLTQLTVLVPYDPQPAKVIEQMVDLTVMMCQQIVEAEENLSVRFEIGQAPEAGVVLPAPVADKVIGYTATTPAALANRSVSFNPLTDLLISNANTIVISDAATGTLPDGSPDPATVTAFGFIAQAADAGDGILYLRATPDNTGPNIGRTLALEGGDVELYMVEPAGSVRISKGTINKSAQSDVLFIPADEAATAFLRHQALELEPAAPASNSSSVNVKGRAPYVAINGVPASLHNIGITYISNGDPFAIGRTLASSYTWHDTVFLPGGLAKMRAELQSTPIADFSVELLYLAGATPTLIGTFSWTGGGQTVGVYTPDPSSAAGLVLTETPLVLRLRSAVEGLVMGEGQVLNFGAGVYVGANELPSV